MSNNKISSIDDLAYNSTLSNIESLYLNNNKIEDISVLNNNTFEKLK